MSTKLSKADRRLVSQGASGARARYKKQSRGTLVAGYAAGFIAAKFDASGALDMPIPLPVVGTKKLAEVIGWPLMLLPLFSKSPGMLLSSGGMAGFSLVVRAQK
ncbi:MAG: hypothetical protein V3V08_23210 [Nannocystaceae bacterium]